MWPVSKKELWLRESVQMPSPLLKMKSIRFLLQIPESFVKNTGCPVFGNRKPA